MDFKSIYHGIPEMGFNHLTLVVVNPGGFLNPIFDWSTLREA